MDDFSWTDTIKAALSPCLSCLQTTPTNTNVNDQPHTSTSRAELEGLLADAGETDNEADALSLHSNIGNRRKRKKKHASNKHITIFGYNVFGKPPIRLDGEDTLDGNVQSGSSRRKPTISTSTSDSDATPLDPSTIDQLSAAQLDQRLTADKQKEERRRQRRERKELERASLALALNREQEEFEGFPGSVTGTYANVPAPIRSIPRDDFVRVDHLDADEGADFEAGMYTARTGGRSSRTESDSLSRTSGSISNPDRSYNHHYKSRQPGPISPPVNPRLGRLVGDVPHNNRRSKASSKTSSSKTSQSSSLLSPVTSTFPTQPIIVPQDQTEFEGFPNGGNFPIVGFGGGKLRRGNGDMGVALARRGND